MDAPLLAIGYNTARRQDGKTARRQGREYADTPSLTASEPLNAQITWRLPLVALATFAAFATFAEKPRPHPLWPEAKSAKTTAADNQEPAADGPLPFPRPG